MNNKAYQLLQALAVCALSACGGGDGSGDSNNGGGVFGGNAICRAIGGGGSSVTATALPPSTFDNTGAAFDGNLGTAAALRYTASGTGEIQGTVQAGTVIPGDTSVGIAFDTPTDGAVNVVVTTYLQGVPQDVGVVAQYSSATAGSDGDLCATGSCSLNRGGMSYLGVISLLPFDALQVVVTVAGDDSALNVRELCVR